jgi:hypothetical protein
MNKEIIDAPPKSIDLRIRRNHLIASTSRLHNVLRSFANEQADYRDKCKQRIGKYIAICK